MTTYRTVSTVVSATPPEAGPPRSYYQAFAGSHPKRYSTDVEARGFEIINLATGRKVATCDTPGWAAQLAAAWNAERAPLPPTTAVLARDILASELALDTPGDDGYAPDDVIGPEGTTVVLTDSADENVGLIEASDFANDPLAVGFIPADAIVRYTVKETP